MKSHIMPWDGSRTKTNITKFAQYIVPLSGVVFYLKQLDLLRPWQTTRFAQYTVSLPLSVFFKTTRFAHTMII